MALQEISLSTQMVQAPASSSGAAKSGASADAAFLSLMQTASQRAVPQGKAPAQGASDGKTEGQLPGDGDTADGRTAAPPYDASALAALFAVQTGKQNPNAVQTAADTVQPGPAASQAAQTSLVQPAQSSAVQESMSLLQPASEQQSSAGPTVPQDTGQKTQTFTAAAQQLPSVAQQTSGSGTPAQTAASVQTGQQPVSADKAVLPEVFPQQTAYEAPQAAAQTAPQRSEATAPAQAQSLPPVPQPDTSGRIVVLSSADTTAQSPVQASDGISGSKDTAAVPAGEETSKLRTAEQGFAGNTGGSGREERISAEDSAGASAPSAAALYAGGKVVIKVSDKTAQTQVSPSRQVANAVAEGFKSGTKQLQVDLYPDSLGKVSVKLTSRDGLLTVQLAADNAKTQDLLASSSGDIRSMLQTATGQSVQVVQPDTSAAQQWYAQDGGSGGQDRQQQENGRRKKDEEPLPLSNVGAISTEDFLTIMRKTVGA